LIYCEENFIYYVKQVNALVMKLVDTKDLKTEEFTNSIVSDSLRESQLD